MAEQKFENSVQELETIVSRLEDGNIELDTALELFEKGINLSKELHNVLNKAEQKVTKLSAETEPKEELFDSPTE
ncbi:MAG: exodeoxyribonuclease VII small subunit [Clostridia bacterium]|nr:exodeoxyribonuclease VII small subunit [Clostridia bacterium]MBR6645888.1 exodeoxyribonuclease VII small subunit [Clostridia bacterium]